MMGANLTTYSFLAELAQSAGLLYFIGTFLAVCVYALWPRNKARFDKAAQMPLQDD
jgi:cytochrome c oxidase cbb3-type subunit IV